jgi:phosphoribosylaminoimidazole-succinocarboxamide synthase
MPQIQPAVLLQTDMPDCKLIGRGKVRDIYALEDALLIVATDRISAFDVVLPTGIPRKGEVLTQLSIFWFEFLKDDIRTHFLTADVDEYPASVRKYRDQLERRSMLVRKLDMVPIECVARAYLSGSGWKEYQATGKVCGIALPPGMRESGKLPETIFTPATKAETGHDENISFAQAGGLVGQELMEELRRLTIEVFDKASQHALACGLVLADTKFEFGRLDGEIVLADEVLTPDSSRYWPLETYHPGRPQPSFDKQFVRDYLESIHFNKQPPGPELPPDIVQKTSEKYLEAYYTITGGDLEAGG